MVLGRKGGKRENQLFFQKSSPRENRIDNATRGGADGLCDRFAFLPFLYIYCLRRALLAPPRIGIVLSLSD